MVSKKYKAQEEYIERTYVRVPVVLTLDIYDDFVEAVEKSGKSKAGWLRESAEEKAKRDRTNVRND